MMLSAKHLAERAILAICLLSRYPLSARLQKGNSPAAVLVRLHQNVRIICVYLRSSAVRFWFVYSRPFVSIRGRFQR
jgi:hypothetical protein